MFNELLKRILSSLILLPIVLFIIIKGSIYFYAFLIIIFLISSYEWFNLAKDKFLILYGNLFLLFSLYCIYELRFGFGDNFIILLFITGICVCTDLGGYIFGKIFKGPKLIKYSPNKTYSGLVGSFLLSFSLMPICFYYDLFYYDQGIKLVIFLFLISASSQFGDIFISYFKRKSNVKDTGKLIPGHGGILDRIDGMIFAFPLAYLLFLFDFLNIKI